MEKVYLKKCLEYDSSKVRAALEEVIKGLGGLDKYIKNGDRIFLKLNLLMKKSPEEAVTTHPVVVEELIKILRTKEVEVVIGDSPGGPFTIQALKGIYRTSGIEEVAIRTGAQLNYDISTTELSFHEGVIVKNFTICNAMMDCDKLISISKLKTHGMTKFTGSVKVLFGVIPGLLKAEYHLKMPDINDFSNMLVDLAQFIKPTISIMDGIVGMEGAGPSAGKPRKIGALIGSTSPMAVDVVATSIVGIAPLSVPTIKAAFDRGLVGELSEIELLGDKLEDYDINNFKSPDISGKTEFPFPSLINNFLNNTLRPRPIFSEVSCVKCGDCMRYCPPKALKMGNNKPIVELDDCIRCFCCQELCPKKAVEIKRSWLSKMFFK